MNIFNKLFKVTQHEMDASRTLVKAEQVYLDGGYSIHTIVAKLADGKVRTTPKEHDGITTLIRCTDKLYNNINVGDNVEYKLFTDGTQTLEKIIS